MKSVLLRRELAQANLTLSEHQEELAYLASDEAAFVNGANISINGGQHMY